MTFVFESPHEPTIDFSQPGSRAGGVSTLSEIMSASYDNMRFVDNTFGGHEILEEAVTRRLSAVEVATGRQFNNPFHSQDRRQLAIEEGQRRLAAGEALSGEALPSISQQLQDLQGQLAGLQKEFPQFSHIIQAEKSIEAEAIEIGRDADERLGRAMENRAGLGKWGAVLAGGFAGALNDPLQVITLGLGAGPSSARTVVGRILQQSSREFVINAGVEAALQPAVQAHRKKLGIDHGLEEAFKNVAFAGIFGAGFGAGIQGGAEIVRPLLRGDDLDAAADLLSGSDGTPQVVKDALNGDTAAARKILEPVKDTLPAETRAALDINAPEETGHAATSIREAVAAIEKRTDPIFSPDPVQVNRVVEQILPERTSAQGGDNLPSLVEFIAGRGGIRDEGNALASIHADEKSIPFVGRLVNNKSGEPLDAAREAAAEAGYFDRLYGTPDNATGSTINDLLDLLSEEITGNKIYPSGAFPEELIDVEAERHFAEEQVAEVIAAAGPGLPDSAIVRTFQIAEEQGIELDDAIEQATMELPELSDAKSVEPLPGWSQEELIEASENRPVDHGQIFEEPEPQDAARAAAENDARFDADIEELGELEIVDPATGDIVPARDLLASASRDHELAKVIEVCRI